MNLVKQIRGWKSVRVFAENALALVLFGLSVAVTNNAMGADIPKTDLEIDLTVKEQSVSEFIDAVFLEINVPVVVHENLDGVVTGRFNGEAKSVLKRIVTAFDVVIYYDGAVAHAYPSNKLVRRMMPVSAGDAKRIQGLVSRSELFDDRNKLLSEDGGMIITGVPRFVEQVEEIAELVRNSASSSRSSSSKAGKKSKVAKPAPAERKMGYRVFKLKHAWAEDTVYNVGKQKVSVPGIATILKMLVHKQGVIGSAVDPDSQNMQQTIDGLRGEGLAEAVAPDSVTQNQESTQSGVVRIVADARLNAVIVSDYQDRIPAYEVLIDSLDVASEMVEIEATIIDINSDRSRELGVDWRAALDDGNISFTDGTADPFTTAAQGGVLSLAFGQSENFLTRIRALEQKGAARVVSKPHVITLSNVEGVLGSTSEFFVRIAGNEEVDLFNVPVGTTLRVKPHVFGDGNKEKIKLYVNIEDGAQSAAGDTVDGIPVVERATINTQAVITEGDSLLVGGLARESFGRSEYRVPLLGSIPILGRAFRSNSNSASRVERLFLITPRISRDGTFAKRADMPRLVGEDDASGFLSDSRRGLDSVDWPASETQSLWPSEAGSKNTDDKANGASDAEPDRINSLASKNKPTHSDANQKSTFVSPFSVKYWEVSN